MSIMHVAVTCTCLQIWANKAQCHDVVTLISTSHSNINQLIYEMGLIMRTWNLFQIDYPEIDKESR